MSQKLTKQQKGFTIIEVLIVLAIAGLIMLIVFLAVPALQRNSRNTQRRNDASRILSAVVEAGNNTNWPSGGADLLGMLGQATQNMGDLGIYQDKTWNTGDLLVAIGAGQSADSSVDKIKVVLGAKCDGESTTAAQARSIAVLYRVETGGGSTPQCESS